MRKPNIDSTIRSGCSPSEFARSFGRHPSWGYRQVYAGKVKVITALGHLLIPLKEIERVMASAEVYNPKPKSKKKDSQQEARKVVTV